MRLAQRLSYARDEPRYTFIPMLNLIFLLLIFFIFQPRQDPEKRLSADLPRETPAVALTTEIPLLELEIKIQPVAGQDAAVYFVGDERLADSPQAYRKIAEMLLRQSGNNRETPIAILPADDVNFESVVRALDGCYEAKMPKIRFGVLPASE